MLRFSPILSIHRSLALFVARGPNDQNPTKDRFPPRLYNPQDPRRRLAVLIDANKIPPSVFRKTIEPALADIGIPILFRAFDHELLPAWQAAISGTAEQSPTDKGCVIEWFRVERFIPISLQMAADANHIFEYREFNKIEGVCYVTSELDKTHVENHLVRLKGQKFNQYIFDELGLALELNEDGRSKDGS
jgi:hypothetical protein